MMRRLIQKILNPWTNIFFVLSGKGDNLDDPKEMLFLNVNVSLYSTELNVDITVKNTKLIVRLPRFPGFNTTEIIFTIKTHLYLYCKYYSTNENLSQRLIHPARNINFESIENWTNV